MTMGSDGCLSNIEFLIALVGDVAMNLITLSLHDLSHSNLSGLFNCYNGCLASIVALVNDFITVTLPLLTLPFLELVATLTIFIDDYTGTAGLRFTEQALWLLSYSEITVVEGENALLEMGGLA
jgi:hypothetical protein